MIYMGYKNDKGMALPFPIRDFVLKIEGWDLTASELCELLEAFAVTFGFYQEDFRRLAAEYFNSMLESEDGIGCFKQGQGGR